MKRILLAVMALLTALVTGCGSGGSGGALVDPASTGGDTGGDSGGTGGGTATTARIRLSTRGPSAGTIIYAVELTLHLPAGVTVSADPASGLVPAGVLQAQDQGAYAGARYLPATENSDGRVVIEVADPSGFLVGAFATLSCVVPAGKTVTGAGFSLDGFSARDANGAVISGVIPELSLLTQ